MTNPQPRYLIIGLFFLLAVVYSLVTPLFEAPDELWHYPFVWHLARGGGLPKQDPDNPQLWGQEGSQPPLYYALAALLTAPIPADDLPELIVPNPHADIGLVRPDGNANIVVHTRREAWPWRGAVLAAHMARLLSAGLGAGTVWATYALTRQIWPERPRFAWLSMGFVAFNPMFLFISASVNNDNLVILLASLTLWQLAKLTTETDSRPGWGRFARLGLLAGLAALSKVSGLGLLGLVGATLLWLGWRRRSWRIGLGGNALVGGLTVLIAGWWYWRNWRLYGDWTGTETMVAMMGERAITPTAGQLLAESSGLIRSFWGLFGYFSVPMPDPIYWLLNLLLIVGLVGLVRLERLPERLRYTWPILAGWPVLLGAALLQWTLRTPASQGRLLFPGLAAVAALWAAGWVALIPRRWQLLPLPLMLALALWIPPGVIAPAYARPEPLAGLPDSAHPLPVTFGAGAQLLGYRLDRSAAQPGQELPLTLYWRAKQPVETNYTLFIHLVDEAGLIVAQRDVFHGPGLYPTGLWQTGQIFADTYSLPVARTAYAPAEAHFEVGLYNHATGVRLPASTGGNRVIFGRVRLETAATGPLPNLQNLQFEDEITLAGYAVDERLLSPGQTVRLTLYWRSRGNPAQNYKVFVHLVDIEERGVAQHDSPPPVPTSAWQAGQLIVDEHPLIVPAPGPYRFVVGLYEPDTGRRLRLLRQGQTPVQADSISLGGVRATTQ